MEFILEWMTKNSTTETVIGEFCNNDKPRLYPRRSSDLNGLTTKRKCQRLPTTRARKNEDEYFPTRRTTGHHSSKEHREQYLEEGLARILVENAEAAFNSRGKMAKLWPSFDFTTKQRTFK